jgi:hypothetical protein
VFWGPYIAVVAQCEAEVTTAVERPQNKPFPSVSVSKYYYIASVKVSIIPKKYSETAIKPSGRHGEIIIIIVI